MVSVVVMLCTRIGSAPPMPTSPTLTTRVRQRSYCVNEGQYVLGPGPGIGPEASPAVDGRDGVGDALLEIGEELFGAGPAGAHGLKVME